MVSIYTAARQTALVLAAVCMGTSGAIAQPSAQTCRVSDLEAASFVLGTWHVEIREATDSVDKPWHVRTGESTWERRVGGCAFIEELTVNEGDDTVFELRLLTHDGRSDEWTLTVVDSHHGNTVRMAGRDAGGALEFTSAQHRRGHLLLDRVTIQSVHMDTLRHVVAASFDLGETWTTLVESHYSRKR